MGITINKPAKVTISKTANVTVSNNDGPLILTFAYDPVLYINGDMDKLFFWNSLFNLPEQGVPFDRLEYDNANYILKLYGGANINLTTTFFGGYYGYGDMLLSIDDQAGCIKSVGEMVFYNAYNLYSAILPAAISFGTDAFAEAYNLTIINFPLLKSVGSGCFYYATNLTSIDLPSLISAGDDCFSSCYYMQSISLPSVETLGSYCFAGCNSLLEVNFPSLLTAGAYCFGECYAITSIDLPSLLSCGDSCFYYCYQVTSLNLPNCVNIGPTTGDDQVFLVWGNAPYMTSATFNAIHDYGGGSYEGDIYSLINTWGMPAGIITWV